LKRAEDSDAWGEELAERAARAVQRHPSGVLLLSELPDADVGEAAARAVVSDVGSVPDSVARPTVTALTPAPHFDTAPVALPMSEPPPAPRISNLPPPPDTVSGISFNLLWPQQERTTVRELEACIAQGDFERGVALADQLVARALASAASLLGGNLDAPRDPATTALLLGLEGRRYLEFRALVRDVRSGRGADASEALSAYAVAIEARLARTRLQTRG
jgi:hypothetical protein